MLWLAAKTSQERRKSLLQLRRNGHRSSCASDWTSAALITLAMGQRSLSRLRDWRRDIRKRYLDGEEEGWVWRSQASVEYFIQLPSLSSPPLLPPLFPSSFPPPLTFSPPSLPPSFPLSLLPSSLYPSSNPLLRFPTLCEQAV